MKILHLMMNDAERELVKSREKIAAELALGVGSGQWVVDELCFPVGYFSDELIERCKRAGYKKVYASFPGSLVDSGKCVVDSYVVPRCLVQDLDAGGFRSVLNGGMNLLKDRYLKRHKISV